MNGVAATANIDALVQTAINVSTPQQVSAGELVDLIRSAEDRRGTQGQITAFFVECSLQVIDAFLRAHAISSAQALRCYRLRVAPLNPGLEVEAWLRERAELEESAALRP